jgi:hypothetical protein
MASCQKMPPEAEEIVDQAMGRKKPLCLSRGFEPTHLVFPLSRRLVRDFRSIISVAILAMAHAWQELSAGSAITPQAIGH